MKRYSRVGNKLGRIWLRDGNSILFRDIKKVWLNDSGFMRSYTLDNSGDIIYE